MAKSIEEHLREHKGECRGELGAIFISWKWALSIIGGMVLSAGGVVWAGAMSVGKMQSNIEACTKANADQDQRIKELESAVSSIKRIEHGVGVLLERVR